MIRVKMEAVQMFCGYCEGKAFLAVNPGTGAILMVCRKCKRPVCNLPLDAILKDESELGTVTAVSKTPQPSSLPESPAVQADCNGSTSATTESTPTPKRRRARNDPSGSQA